MVRVHNLVKYQNIPSEFITDNIWNERYEQIRNFEDHMYKNGTIILKFYLNVSKEEQKNRFLRRLEIPSKNWKFSAGDLEERKLWEEYQKCYEDAINETATPSTPWYIIPADKKWYMRLAVSEVIINTLNGLNMEYPRLDEEQLQNLGKYKEQLENE